MLVYINFFLYLCFGFNHIHVMQKEKWKSVIGFEGLYEVSDKGRIRSIDRWIEQQGRMQLYKGCIMSQYINNSGYLMIRLSKENKKYSFTVHRLVASAFVPNPNGFQYVNHKDENKTNNSADNLEWCTNEYNINYGTATLRRAKKMGTKICQYDLEGNLINEYYSIKNAAKVNGIPSSTIGDCVRGNICQSHGYIWVKTSEADPPKKIEPVFRKNSARPVVQYDIELNLIREYPNAHVASKETGVNGEGISCCCRGEARTAGGFIWCLKGCIPTLKRVKNQKEVVQFDMNMNEIRRFESPQAASNFLGGGKSPGIRQCIYGKNKSAYGYIWRYAEEVNQ